MALFRRRKGRPSYTPPSPPCPDELRRVEEMRREADEQYAEVEARDTEVRERGEHMAKIHRVNRIGPRFMDALGIRKERRA